GRRGARGDALERVPQLGIPTRLLVRRKVALEHATVGSESLDAGLDILAPRDGELLGGRRRFALAEIEAERGHADAAALVSGIPHGSWECQASLRAGWSQGGRFGWRGCVLTEAERAEPAEFEASEQQRGAVLERAGGGLMQDAQQQERDQRDIDLDAHGI